MTDIAQYYTFNDELVFDDINQIDWRGKFNAKNTFYYFQTEKKFPKSRTTIFHSLLID